LSRFAVHVRAGTCFIMTRSLRQKRKACLRARTQGFEPPGMDGAVCKAMMLRIVTPGRHAPIRTRPKVIMSVCPPVDDAHGFSLDMPGVLQALAPCAQAVRHRLRRSGVEEPNHRYCWLLRPRHQDMGIAPQVNGRCAAPYAIAHRFKCAGLPHCGGTVEQERSSGPETLSPIRSSEDYTIDMHESDFSEATGVVTRACAQLVGNLR
jgi:hypothetical protein